MQNVEDILRLSPMQQGLLFHSLYAPGSGEYVMQVGWTLSGPVDRPAFEAAWQLAVARNPILRTAFFWEGLDEPLQVVRQEVALPWEHLDWRSLPPAEQEARFARWLEADRRAGFDLTAAPLMRITELHLGEGVWRYVWSHHHILLDGWSGTLVFQEVFALYQARVRGQEPPPVRRRPFRDYIAWLEGRQAGETADFWRRELAGFTSPSRLVPEASASGDQAAEAAGYTTRRHCLSPAATAALVAFGRRHKLTLNTLVMGMWGLLLGRYSGRRDVVFGAVVSGRPPSLAGAEEMIGLFVNTLPVRLGLPPGRPLLPWLEDLQKRLLALRRQEHASLARIQEAAELPPGEALFDHLLAFENLPVADSLSGAGEGEGKQARVGDFFRSEDRTGYAVSVAVFPDDRLLLQLVGDARRLGAAALTRMTGHYARLLTALAEDPHRPLAELPLLGPGEAQQLLREWTLPAADPAPEVTFLHLVRRQAEARPDAVAAGVGAEQLTYGELRRRAEEQALSLRRQGVGPESLVALLTPRGLGLLVGILGVWEAGGAYLPLDPAHPAPRLARILERASATVALAAPELRSLLAEAAAAVPADVRPELGDLHASPPPLPDAPAGPLPEVRPGHLAYVIFTSGSTGEPKGAMVEHGGMLNHLWAKIDDLHLTAADRVLQNASQCFDISVWQHFAPLALGGRTEIVDDDLAQYPPGLWRHLAAARVSVLEVVPSLLRILLESAERGVEGSEAAPALRWLVPTGEALPPELARRWLTALPGVPVVNAYGPTECSDDVTHHLVSTPPPGDLARIPIGRPVRGTRLHVLTPDGSPAPVGVAGELLVAGHGVGRGYRRDPGRTAEVFVPDPGPPPADGDGGGRLYRTGDLVRWLPDGRLDFLGRLDFQVKVHGFRIELGEIEGVLRRHPALEDAAVVARSGGLVAYVVRALAGAPEREVEGDSLRRHLGRTLPEYMVPGAFVTLDALPLTANGKVDRRALPEPGLPAREGGRVAPRNRLESQLAALWADALGREEVGIHDNFFELGGDSILSIQLAARIAELGHELYPRHLFENPTVAALAALLAAQAEGPQAAAGIGEGPAAVPGAEAGAWTPLAPIQADFFALAGASPGARADHYNQAVLVAMDEALAPADLTRAVQALVAHHEALRLRFEVRDGVWRQRTLTPEEAGPPPVHHLDLSRLQADHVAAAVEAAAEAAQARLDLAAGPVMRLVSVQLGSPQAGRLLWVLHHLVVDGVSWQILLGDLARAYGQLTAGSDTVTLAPVATTYTAWVRALEGLPTSGEGAVSTQLKAARDHWLSEAFRCPPAFLPDDPGAEDVEGETAEVETRLPEALTRALVEEVPSAYRTRIHEVLLAALAGAVAELTGEGAVRLDLEGHGRQAVPGGGDLSRTVGWLTSLYPVVLSLPQAGPGGEGDPGALLVSVKEQLRAVPGDGMPYGVLRWLGEGEVRQALRALPESTLAFNYLGRLDAAGARAGNGAVGGFRAAGESYGTLRHPRLRRRHAVEIDAAITGGALRVRWAHGPGVFAPGRIRALAGAFETHLRRLIEHCTRPETGALSLSDFPLARQARLSAEELPELLAATGHPHREIEDLFSLSGVQEGLLVHAAGADGSGVYILQLSLALSGRLDPAAFRRAWEAVLTRHSALRTAFLWQRQGDRPLQWVARPGSLKLPWHEEDWSSLSGTGGSAAGVSAAREREQLETFLADDRQRGFTLEHPPLLRLSLLRLPDGEGGEPRHRFVWTFHHLILDGWSLPLLIADLFALYRADLEGAAADLPPGRPYRDYVAWLAGQDLGEAEEFWRRRLAGFTEATRVGPDRGPEAAAEEDGEGPGQARLVLPVDRLEELTATARRHRLTLSTLVHGAWGLLLGRYAGSGDVVFGSVSSGRSAPVAGIGSMLGLFINTLPLRLSIPRHGSAAEWLRSVQASHAELRQYEHSPLTRIQGWSDVPRGQALFHSILAFENYPLGAAAAGGGGELRLEDVEFQEATHFPLTLVVLPHGELAFKVLFDRRRFRRPEVERMLGHLRNLIEGLAGQPGAPPVALPVLAAEERRQLLAAGGERPAAATAPAARTLVEHFLARVERGQDAVAVVAGEETLTYAGLEARSRALALRLRRRGVGPETLVGLCAERGTGLLAGLIAILRAGGAYLPLDPSYPEERLRTLVQDSGISRVVATPAMARLLEGMDGLQVEIIPLEDPPAFPGLSVPDGEVSLLPDHAAYVIYTSGSTGRPKGVVLAHRQVDRLLCRTAEWFDFGPGDVWSLFHSYSFDFSVWEIWGALAYGGRLEVVPEATRRFPDDFRDFLLARRVTVLNQTPSAFRPLVRALTDPVAAVPELPLRWVIFGGEALEFEILRPWFERFGDRRPGMVNMYGITETAVHSTWRRVTGQDLEAPDPGSFLGVPIPDLSVHVLDPLLELTPEAMSGEIWVAGAGQARCYLGRPALTAERFVPDSFGPHPGERLYRSGDLARRRDGELDYLGRLDFQVKIRGFRVELGEIEAALLRHPEVAEAAVLAREAVGGEEGLQRLVAYVVFRQGEAKGPSSSRPAAADLRVFLAGALPEHMIPALFVPLPELPLTPNGKLDRRALPAPEVAGPTTVADAGEPPRGEAEEALAEIWRSVLGVPAVSRGDNFFELGGDSILGLQIVSRAARAGLRLRPTQLFEHPTLRDLAAVAGRSLPPAGDAGEEEALSGPFPLTPIQRWFLAPGPAEAWHFNQSLLLQVREPLDRGVLERAVRTLVKHHEALTLSFDLTAGDRWTAAPRPASAAPPRGVHEVDLGRLAPAHRRRAVEAGARRLQRSLDLVRGPLLRCALFRAGSGEADRLFLVAHHLVVDGVSWRILLEDLEAACRHLAAGGEPALPPRTTSFGRWARLLDEARSRGTFDHELPFWRRLLAAPRPRLPVDFEPGPAGAGDTDLEADDVASTRGVVVTLEAEATAALLREAPRAYRARPEDLLLAALAEVVAGWTGERVLLAHLEGHGREIDLPSWSRQEDLLAPDTPDLARTVGWFTSLYPVRLELEGVVGPGAVIRAVKEQLRAVPHRGLGYGVLRHLPGPEERESPLAGLPEPEIVFNYLGRLDRALPEGSPFAPAPEDRGLERSPAQRRAWLLEVEASVREGQLHVTWSYSVHRHRAGTIEALAGNFLAALRVLIEHCARRPETTFTASDFPLVALPAPVLERTLERGREVGRFEDLYPLSPLQRGLLYHSHLDPNSGVYVEQLTATLSGSLDVAAFAGAWEQALERHPALRSAFLEGAELSEPLQAVYGDLPLPLACLDLGALDTAAREARFRELCRRERHRGFALSRPPLMRLLLVRSGPRHHRLIWTLHHLLVDGWSMALLMGEVLTTYGALAEGRSPDLPPARPYRDYIAWLARQDAAASEAFWRSLLAGLEAPTPLPFQGSGETGSRGFERLSRALPREATADLVTRARGLGLTLSTIVQAAWALLLSRHSGSGDVIYGLVTSGRSAPVDGIDAMLGLFINTLPVRCRVPAGGSAAAWLGELQGLLAEIRHHEHTPLERIQGWSGVPGGRGLFDSIVVFENYPAGKAEAGGSGELELGDLEFRESTHFPLTVVALPGDELELELLYDGALFRERDVERLAGHLEVLLRELARPEADLGSLSPLTPEERREILHLGRGAVREGLGNGTLHGLVAEQVRRTPEALAVIDDGAPGDGCGWTYRQLHCAAQTLARRLVSLGVRPEVPVGVCVERSLDLVVALLAVLEAGGAYVPLDPGYPPRRLRQILEDALGGVEAPVVITRREESRVLGELPPGVSALFLDRPGEGADAEAGLPEADGLTAVDGENLAYVIFTSGSTGRPKGAMNTHRAIVNRLRWMQSAYPLDAADRVLQKTPASFDVSVWEFFWPLTTGACLVLARPEGHRDRSYLADLIRRRGVTTLHFVPSMLRTFLSDPVPESHPAPSLRRVIASGEALGQDLVDRFFSLGTSAAVRPAEGAAPELHNLYGPTEAAVDVTARPCRPGEVPGTVPLGRAIDNLEILLLDPAARMVARGVPGELHIAGVGLARGYRGRPGLTAGRFVPRSARTGGRFPGERLYRSGDLARFGLTGDLEFLGRLDFQVKVRGFRIELGDIEAALLQHPSVGEAVVSAVTAADGGAERTVLVAYVVAAEVGGELEPAALRGALTGRLPEYMVPAFIIPLPELPRTPSGKLDRRALPAVDAGATVEEGFAPPSGPVEEILAGIWSDLLGVIPVGRRHHFFDLGGDSLLATRVLSRLSAAFGVDVPLRRLLDEPTLEAMAREVEAARQGGAASPAPPLAPQPRARPPEEGERPSAAPLSFAQERLWFLDRLEPGEAVYNVPCALELHGPLDPASLAAAFTALAARHQVLRTVYPDRDGVPFQRVLPAAELPLPCVDLSALDEARARALLPLLIRHEARRPFDLAAGPIWRRRVVRLGPEHHAALLTLHHIATDGWSLAVLTTEVAELYRARREGRPAELPELPVQYADYAAWQRSWLRGETLEAEMDFWRRYLDGAPPLLELPTDRPRSAARSQEGASVSFLLPPARSEAVLARARQLAATPFMFCLAAFKALLRQRSGQRDVTVGISVAGRSRQQLEGLVGFFVNTLVLRTELSGEQSFLTLLGQVRRDLLEGHAHQEVPFEKLVEELAPERSLTHSPLFQVSFTFQNTPRTDVEAAGLEVSNLESETGLEMFDLSLSMAVTGEGLAGSLSYRRDLFDATTARRLAGAFQRLLDAAVTDPEASLVRLSRPAEAELQQLREWNDTGCLFQRGYLTLHRLVAEQAGRTPEAVAVTFRDEHLSFGALLHRAMALARRLRARGVGRGDRVGLLTEPCLELPVGQLSILLAGGAYVPLDPELPEARLTGMLADAGVAALLSSDREGGRVLPASGPEGVVPLLAELEGEREPAPGGGPVEVCGDDLAYVLFTSGSTGRPKGVANHHRGIVNRLLWMQSTLPLKAADRLLLKTSIAFDVSVGECFLSLAAGARLVIAEPGRHGDPEYLIGVIRERGITVVDFVPSLLRSFVEHPGFRELPSLRRVTVGGEVLPPALAERFLAGSEAELVNFYGPTEAAVDVTWWPVRRGGVRTPIPIGRAMGNTRLRVADRPLHALQVGTSGELLVGGVHVARGYLGRPAATAASFVPDPWGGTPGGRLYRTGDRARWRPEGSLEFLGRLDHQVKVRGLRIELGEIEAVLAEHPGVAGAAVVAGRRADGGWQPGESGTGELLVAYAEIPGPDGPGEESLRSFLAGRLPAYMVPSQLVRLTALPRTPGGKVDRRRLSPPPAAPEGKPGCLAAGTVQELLAGLWEEILGTTGIGPGSDFFVLGGHSLLAAQLIARIRRAFGVELPLRALFEARTLEALARRVSDSVSARAGLDLPPLEAVRRDGPVPLSFPQQRLWFLDQLEPGNPFYNMGTAVRLSGELDTGALTAALATVVERHEALRTVFATAGEGCVQVVLPKVPVSLPVVDLAGLATPGAAGDPEVVQSLVRAEAGIPFDLARGPLWRLRLLRRNRRDHVLLLTLHHIIGDGWSMEVLVRELVLAYRGHLSPGVDPASLLPPLPIQYPDFALWQRRWLDGEVLEDQLGYWRRHLAGVPSRLRLPADHPRPAVQSFRGGEVPLALEAAQVRRLRELGRRRGATLFMTLLAAYQVLLHDLSGEANLVLGAPVSYRNWTEVEGLVGFFANLLVLRVRVEPELTFPELLERSRETVLEAYARQHVPFEKLVEELAPERNLGHNPLVQVTFNFLDTTRRGEPEALPGLEVKPLELGAESTQFELNLSLEEVGAIGTGGGDGEGDGGGIAGVLQFNRDLFEAETVRGWARDWQSLLGWIVEEPEISLAALRERLAGEREADRGSAGEKAEEALGRSFEARRRGSRRRQVVSVSIGEAETDG